MGVFSGPYNTVGGDVGTYNTVCVRVATEYYFMLGMVPGTVVLTCEPCLAFLRTSSGSFRMGCPRSDDSSRLSVRRSEKSGEQASHEPWSRGRSRRVGVAGSE